MDIDKLLADLEQLVSDYRELEASVATLTRELAERDALIADLVTVVPGPALGSLVMIQRAYVMEGQPT